MKVYLNNSVIGRLLDIERGIKRGSKMLTEDMAVITNLLRICIGKGIRLCTSNDTYLEIEKLRATMPQLTDTLISRLQSFTLLPAQFEFSQNYTSEVDLLSQELEAGFQSYIGNDHYVIVTFSYYSLAAGGRRLKKLVACGRSRKAYS